LEELNQLVERRINEMQKSSVSEESSVKSGHFQSRRPETLDQLHVNQKNSAAKRNGNMQLSDR